MQAKLNFAKQNKDFATHNSDDTMSVEKKIQTLRDSERYHDGGPQAAYTFGEVLGRCCLAPHCPQAQQTPQTPQKVKGLGK